MKDKGNPMKQEPTEAIRVSLRLSPEKVISIQTALADLGIVNLTSACNYLLNKGLEQSAAMAANSRVAVQNLEILNIFKESLEMQKDEESGSTTLDYRNKS